MKTTRLSPGRFELDFAPAKGGPIEVLRKNEPVWTTSYSYVPLSEWEHELRICMDLFDAGHVTRAGIRKFALKRTRRWVIDDLYAAVMVKK